jgi:hypothetical protein
MPTASTAAPLPFLVVPRPTAIDPFRPTVPTLVPTPGFSTLTNDRVRLEPYAPPPLAFPLSTDRAAPCPVVDAAPDPNALRCRGRYVPLPLGDEADAPHALGDEEEDDADAVPHALGGAPVGDCAAIPIGMTSIASSSSSSSDRTLYRRASSSFCGCALCLRTPPPPPPESDDAEDVDDDPDAPSARGGGRASERSCTSSKTSK